MRNVSEKNFRENQNTHFVFEDYFSKKRAFYEIKWKDDVEPVRPQMKIWRLCIDSGYLRLQTHSQNT